MAATTIFHLSSSDAAPITVTYDAVWNQTGEADRVKMTAKFLESTISTLTDKTVTIPITTTQNILVRQYVSNPIPPQRVITPILTGPVRCFQSVTTANCVMFLVAKIVSNDGTVLRASLISQTISTALATAAATRPVNNATSTNVSTLPGDRLVVEYGVTATAPSTSGTATFRFGSSAASDFANSSGLTTDLNPWLAFAPDFFSPVNNNYQSIKVGNGMSVSERIR